MTGSAWYFIRRWWIRRQLTLIHYRREELKCIAARELRLLDEEEKDANRRLRELSSERLNAIAERSAIRRM